jgi:hypothetical protein
MVLYNFLILLVKNSFLRKRRLGKGGSADKLNPLHVFTFHPLFFTKEEI